MAVKIRLKRMGAKKRPFYRIVVADARSPRDGRFIESVGYYDPLRDPKVVKFEDERIRHWMATGAKPSDAVRELLERAGMLPATPRPVRAPKQDGAAQAAAPTAAAATAAAEVPAEAAAEAAAEEAPAELAVADAPESTESADDVVVAAAAEPEAAADEPGPTDDGSAAQEGEADPDAAVEAGASDGA